MRLMKKESSNVRFQAVSVIKTTIKRNPKSLLSLMGDSSSGGILARLLTALLTHCMDPNQRVRLASCECIGEVGALDPGTFAVSLSSSKTRIADDDRLARFLICDKLIKSVKAATNTSAMNKTLYAIQELLKFCGCDADTPTLHVDLQNGGAERKAKRRGAAELLPAQRRGVENWDHFPPDIRTLITPCLSSRYSLQIEPPLNNITNSIAASQHQSASSAAIPGPVSPSQAFRSAVPHGVNSSSPQMSQAVITTKKTKARTNARGKRGGRGAGEGGAPSQILYRPDKKLRHWLAQWTRHLITRSTGARAKIFQACRGVVT
eukprot:jgi/Bigna1/146751/aug1.120_g21459